MDHAKEDILLWEAFRNGDRDAFATLFRRHYEGLYRYGGKFIDNPGQLEDSIQELFVELWQSKSRIPVTSVRAYLLKSLKYKILKTYRRRRSLLPIGDSQGSFEWSHEDRLIAGERDAENSKKVLNALDRLSNRQKEIVYLKYFQNLSYEEISEVMNINYQVARNLLYQAIRSLKTLLAGAFIYFFLLSQ
ncbi:MAG TPA: sigma-70 family RNA polymerase sigma factor [Puia sp.]|nr:sigma-70 family RNA polymerase sigma factor [Puia sp.]